MRGEEEQYEHGDQDDGEDHVIPPLLAIRDERDADEQHGERNHRPERDLVVRFVVK